MDTRHRAIENHHPTSNWLKGSLYFFLIILPGLVMGYYSYLSLRDQLDQSPREQKASRAYLSATIVQERLTHLSRLGITYAAKPSVSRLVKAGKWNEAMAILQEIEAYSPNIDRLFLADSTGTVMADSPSLQGARGKNYGYRNWYQGLKNSGWKPHISSVTKRIIPPYVNVVNGSFAIKDANGKIWGILVMQFHMRQFKTWGELQTPEKDENIYILDQAGQVVSGTNLAYQHGIINYARTPAAQKALKGHKGVEKLYNPVKKADMLTAYAPVRGFGWGVIVEQPYKIAYAERDKSLASILLIFGFIFLLNCLFAYLVLYNISKLRTTKERLRKNEERYALAMEGTNDGLWDWNVRTNKVFFSARWKSMIGFAEDEFPNNFQAWQDRVHPDDLDRVLSTIQAYFDKKIPIYEVEYRMRHKDGNYRWILARGMALWDQEGKVYRMLGSHSDLTQRKRLEEENLETQNFLDSVVENVPIMLFVKDAKNLRFYRWNKAGQELIGFSQEELIGKSDYDFFPKEQADFFVAKDRAVLDSKKLSEIPEEVIETRDNGTRILHTRKIPILDHAGNPVYLLGISEDITEQKKAEAQILELNDKLAHQVAQLEKTNQELKDVTHIISHDLKAPLRGIEMLGEWLLTDCLANLDEKCRNHIVLMNERVRRMHNLIEGILRYAHIGRTSGEKEEIDLNLLIPEITDLISPPANITVQVVSPLPRLKAERAPVLQLFQNLISNAVKYMDKPQGLVKIGATEEEKHWHFYVEDNGPGIEKEYYQRIFQIFQTLQARDDFESTGIGLTIVKKIVETFGGTIWVTSEIGQGTTFHFTIAKEMIVPA